MIVIFVFRLVDYVKKNRPNVGLEADNGTLDKLTNYGSAKVWM